MSIRAAPLNSAAQALELGKELAAITDTEREGVGPAEGLEPSPRLQVQHGRVSPGTSPYENPP